MDYEKIVKTPERQVSELRSRDIKIINKLMAKAVKEEDYAVAAILRDLKDSDIKYELSRRDVFNLRPGLTKLVPEDDPRIKVWESIDKEREKDYWEGKETIENSYLSYYLERSRSEMTLFGRDLMGSVDKLGQQKGGPRIDFLIHLYKQESEAKTMADISQEKIDSIWLPYCEKAGLNAHDRESYFKDHIEFGLTDDQQRIMKLPYSVNKPLAFWQRVNENAKVIIDEVQDVIRDLEEK